jgi:hypothetical protein
MSPLVPTVPGSYRWYYVDVSNDEWSAVFIFMVGWNKSAIREYNLPSQYGNI